MKMYEMRKDGVYGIGFIDPNTIHEVTIQNNTKEMEILLLKSLRDQHAHGHILFLYLLDIVI